MASHVLGKRLLLRLGFVVSVVDDDLQPFPRRICSGCCAPTASGQDAAAPPSSVMKSRRFTRSPRRRAAEMIPGF
jgi:hypothetical protein